MTVGPRHSTYNPELTGAAIYGAWLAIGGVLAWWLGGPTAAVLTVMLMPLLAIAALFAIEREAAVVDAVRAWRLLGRARHDTRDRLRRRRSDLADVLDEVNQWLGDPTGVRN